MKLKFYQVDAFTDNVFGGNPAAVCPLQDEWLEDTLMHQIAIENNVSDTAFYIFKGNRYHIRWFTPGAEVDLCGHATLATGFVLYEQENYKGKQVDFESKSGKLSVMKDNSDYILDFPADDIEEQDITDEMKDAFNVEPVKVYKGVSDLMFIYDNQDDIINIEYDLSKIALLTCRGVIITAPGDNAENKPDFVSRFFAPRIGISEDPVTGSAHTTLTPYWAGVLNKTEMRAIQLSTRKGHLVCKLVNKRVQISGKAKLYLKGEIYI